MGMRGIHLLSVPSRRSSGWGLRRSGDASLKMEFLYYFRYFLKKPGEV